MGDRDYLHVLCPPLWEKLPPVGPAWLAEYIGIHGWSFRLCDLNQTFHQRVPTAIRKEWTVNRDLTRESFFQECMKLYQDVFEALFNTIHSVKPAALGFSLFSSNREFVTGLIRMIRIKFPLLKLIVGGPETFAIDASGDLDSLDADAIVVGEGEQAILDILEGRSQEKVVRFRELADIEFFPRYFGISLENYSRKNALSITASRGCIYRCSFCSERLLYQGFRMRSPESVFEEISYHYQKNRVRWFTFHDSLLNADYLKLGRLLDYILTEDLKIQWDAQIAVRRDMPLELLVKMKQSGCINLFVGMESGSASLLAKMNKRFQPEDAIAFFCHLKEAGLNYEISLIAHYPGENQVEFEETLEFLRKNSAIIPKIAQISLYRKYPGTNVLIPEDYREEDGPLKLEKLVNILDELKIRYTRSYINNLI